MYKFRHWLAWKIMPRIKVQKLTTLSQALNDVGKSIKPRQGMPTLGRFCNTGCRTAKCMKAREGRTWVNI